MKVLINIEELELTIDSSNITTDHFKIIAEILEKNYWLYDSFIILHGTDTMTYTGSILSFMIQNLQKNIILTGAMIPLSEYDLDAFNDFLGSIVVASVFKVNLIIIRGYGGKWINYELVKQF